MLIILLLLFFFKKELCANSVFIREPNYSSNEYFLTCGITGADSDKFTPHLHCPLTKSQICYSNCTDATSYSNGKKEKILLSKPIYDCKYRFFGSDHIEIQYYLNPSGIPNGNGEWYCSYAGVNSKAIVLKWSETKSFTTQKSFVKRRFTYSPPGANIRTMTTVIDVVTVPTVTSKAREIIQSPPNSSNDDDISFKTFITKFQVVIGILCLFAISIVLNLVFCIRDSLIKYYIENIKNNILSNKFLLFCVCQRDSLATMATSRLDRVLSQETAYSRSDPPNSQNNLYDPQTMYISNQQQQPFIQEIIPSPPLGRARSFQYYSPLLPPRTQDQYYMSLPRRASMIYNYGIPANSQGGFIGGTSINGSEPYQEDGQPRCFIQIDQQGNQFPVRLIPTNNMANRQSVDLINDCDRNLLSENASDTSKND